MPTNDFPAVFAALKAILKKLESRLEVQTDTDDTYYLNSKLEHRNRPICFGWVSIEKNYVSFHLMPVYGCRDLVDGLSPELRARMQGKACFNFKTVDRALLKELAQLTKDGFDRFKKGGYI